jgi:hypothetical protein
MSASKAFFRGFGRGMKDFGHNIAMIVNTVLLLIVYIVGVGLTSIVAKLAGKHFMDIDARKKGKSYWSELNLGKKKTEEYYRQF